MLLETCHSFFVKTVANLFESLPLHSTRHFELSIKKSIKVHTVQIKLHKQSIYS